MRRDRTVPVQDLGITKMLTPAQLWAYCQHNILEDGEDPIMCADMEPPEHGEVKVYTEEEIAEYEKQRDWILEDAERRLQEELDNVNKND